MEHAVLRARHRLHESPLFGEAGLCRMLDAHPRDEIHIHTMSGTSAAPEYRDADIGESSGAEVLEAVRRGKLWVSVLDMQEHHPACEELLADMYAELEATCPGFRSYADSRLMNLLISSPRAEVFYHADASLNMLWHLRGRKRLYVYPPWDERFLDAGQREMCLLGTLVDGPWRPELDAEASVFNMDPGDVVTWPQSTPHRVVNLEGLNVSLSTEHYTPDARRRKLVAGANWWLRNRWRIPARSLEIRGPAALAKRTAFRAARLARRLIDARAALVPEDPAPPITIRVDPSGPDGYIELSPRV